MRNKNKPWFKYYSRRAFELKQEARIGGLVIALALTGMRLSINRGGLMKSMPSLGVSDVLMNSQCPHKGWPILKPAVFGSSSSLPPLDGGLAVWCVCRLDRRIDCRPIVIASSLGIQCICHPLAIRLHVLLPLPSGLCR